MKKFTKRLALLLCLVMLATMLTACGDDGDSKGGSADEITGTWKQTDEVNGNWTWTFSDGKKARLQGETTGFDSNGTYELDEANKKVKVTLDNWSDTKEYTYTLNGNTLDLNETYSNFHLEKQ